MQEYGVNRNLVKRAKQILRNCKGRKMTERFACDVCRVVYDSGWVYAADGGDFHICHSCRNKYLPGKMQRWRLYSSAFESSKKKH
ncbi:hypothetical protein GMD79_06510 [Parabacteroides merdae]|nr:hypothetical protein [Parabacteroides merdae]MTU64723.1 hypothetical protein [Parabacteroides merdae]MTU82317.1 hypothetical protein [Parabacteroides merdae]MTU89792.1 hypothetical protein [Parabacteroides merdae]MTU95519.1 hypothetical protein [Parabacteroides merdae]